MFGTFTTFRHFVQVTVGDRLPNETATIRLTAYDVRGALVAQSPAHTVIGGSGVRGIALTAVDSGSIARIAYFLVQAEENNRYIWVDDLTFDNPPTPPPADFALGTPIGRPLIYWLTPGGTSETKTILISRFNESSGNITFSTSSLPPGLSPSFTPNPVPRTGTSTSVTLNAAANARLIRDGTFTVTAVPADAAVGPEPRQTKVTFNVLPQFSLGVQDSIHVPPCTPVHVSPIYVSPIYVSKGPGFTGEVALTLRVPTADGGTRDLPSGLQASFEPSSVVPRGPQMSLFGLTLTSDGSVSGDLPVVVQGTSGGLLFQSTPSTIIHFTAAGIDYVAPSSGRTPQSLQPGTQVHIKGHGFCPGIKVRFGNRRWIRTR